MEVYLFVLEQLLIFLGLSNIVAVAIGLVGTIVMYILGTLLEGIDRKKKNARPTIS
jgi:hypothetical protein